MKAEETIDYHLRCAWNLIARHYNAEAAKYGATMASGYVLLYIDINDGTPSTKLGPLMGMEPRSLVRTLSMLEEKGLIIRQKSKEDKRVVLIQLTDLGKEKRKLAKESVIELNNLLFSKIDKEKLVTFFDVMETITDTLKENNY
ncbi:MarR family winged helix-turn-helix transcriptional regulator [Luteibaculum oceani]|uniref:MarR family transcriptional regulator n=1 Tax=Luteibaculum oceani TaxID=1294296 RepID=A0A5C6V205_9FLAO|nr:MarR family transcriptional regulator [Luteibaculum oceani]TXC78456.1 MarR family transcriptional regulator [Luteibaculum oceani]